MTLHRRLLLCFLAATVGGLAACGGNSEEDEESQNGHVRLVNATSYSSVDFYESDNKLASSIAEGTGSGYATLDESGYTFKVKQAGTTTTLVSSSQTAYEDQWYSLVAYSTAGSLKTAYLADNETAPGSGTTKLRIYNASTEAGALDVFVTGTSDDISQLTPTISSATAETATSFQEISAGTYRIRVTGTGDPTDVRLDIPSLTLGSQHVDTLVLTTGKGGVLVDGVMLTQRGSVSANKNTAARIRLAASTVPTGNSVKVAFDSTTTFLSSTSPAVGAYALIPAGTLNMTLTIGGSSTATATGTATAGDDITLLVSGTSTVTIISDDNKPPLSSANARLRLYNGLNGLSSTLTLTSDGSIIGDGIALGGASSFATVTGDDHDLELTSPGQATSVYGPATRTLLANKVYSLFALGTATAPTIVLRANR